MALISRVSRLFRADLHAVLDHIEEPQMLLRQSIRDMDDATANDAQRRAQMTKDLASLGMREAELQRGLESITEKLDACFEAGNDTLARTLVRRRLESERFAQMLERKRVALEQDRADLDRRIEDNRVRLDAMRQKAEILAADVVEADGETGYPGPDNTISADDVEVALLHEKQRRAAS